MSEDFQNYLGNRKLRDKKRPPRKRSKKTQMMKKKLFRFANIAFSAM